MVFWPRQPLSSFIVAETVPHTSFLIFIATLIVYSYVNLCCGCGDMIQRSYHITHLTDISTFEKENGFFQYGLFEFLLHTLILLLPFIPLLILPAAISAISLITFIQAIAILYTASLICRLMGFMVYLFWGRLSTAGYFMARVIMFLFMFGTIFFAPFINPLRQLYLLIQRPDDMGFVAYMGIITVATLCLVITNHILVERNIERTGSSRN